MFYIRRDTKAERKSSSRAPVAAASPGSFINHCPGFGETIYMRRYSARRRPRDTLTSGIVRRPQVSLCRSRRAVSWFYLRDHTGSQIPLDAAVFRDLTPLPGGATVPTLASSAVSTFENSCFLALLSLCIPRRSVYTVSRQAGVHARRRAHIFQIVPKNQM